MVCPLLARIKATTPKTCILFFVTIKIQFKKVLKIKLCVFSLTFSKSWRDSFEFEQKKARKAL